MKNPPRTFLKLLCATVAPTVLVSSFYVNAEPGVLQNVPFSVTAESVQPNILFILDDSTSMDWEEILFNGSEQVRIYNDFTPDTDTEYLRSCAGFNRLFFDPNITYTPWAGFDENEQPYRDQIITAARIDPYRITTTPQSTYTSGQNVTVTKQVSGRSITQAIPADRAGGYGYMTSGDTGPFGDGFVGADLIGVANLLNPEGIPGGESAGYTEWNDSGGPGSSADGIFQSGECGIGSSNFIRLSDIIANVGGSRSAEQIADFLTNYANWFSYYRSRSFAAKNALLSVVENSRARVGVIPLFDPNISSGFVGSQNGTNNGGLVIKDIDVAGNPDPSDDTIENNRKAVLDYIASSTSSLIATPLRNSLNQAGRYFHERLSPNGRVFRGDTLHNAGVEGTLNNNTPILNQSLGGVCQRNFTILFTDGDATLDGFSGVDNADADDPVSEFDGIHFADSRSNTLADIAMFYLENDLSPGSSGLANTFNLRDNRRPGVATPGLPVVPAGVINHQHMTTYTIAFGVRDNSGSVNSNINPDLSATSFNWPENSISDLRHAAWNGRGSFLNSSGPQALIDDIDNVFEDITAISQATATASSVSSGFISEGSLVFQTNFDSADWSGNLLALRFDTNNVVDISNPVFDTASVLNTRLTVDNFFVGVNNADGYNNSRFIFTKAIDLGDTDPTATTPNSLQADNAVLFSFNNLSPSQQRFFTSERSAIGLDWVGSDIEFGGALVDYLAGDSTHEEGISGELASDGGQRIFRDRGRNYLGAIVNSSPEFVGIPNENYPDQIEGSAVNELYSGFVSRQSSRTPIVYVGANDGMLHAFNTSVDVSATSVTANTSSGDEVFAYVPAVLTEELSQLASPSYNFDSFVDATATARDVFIDNQWATYLVGGLRNGARAIYALDVTNPVATLSGTGSPQSQAQSIAKFEYTHPDLGFTYSRIQIARMNNGSWVAIVGNGYNSVGDGRGKLFIIDLATGLPLSNAGPIGSDGIFDTGVGSIMNSLCTDAGSDCNGLSEPTIVDLNGDFITDRIYAGDLHGNMWVFNVEDTDPRQWTMTLLFTATQSACTTGPSTDCRQPITTRPVVSLHPSRRSLSTEPNVLVLFGTGQFIAEGDGDNTEDQTFYSIWDTTGASVTANNSRLTKSDLVERTFGGTLNNITVTGPVANYNTAASPSAARNFGWYINLTGSITNPSGGSSDPFDRGRVSINPVISGSVVFFVTTVPSTGGACLPGVIPGFLSALDVESGQTPSFSVFVDDSGVELNTSTIVLAKATVGFDIDSVTTGTGTQIRSTNQDGTFGKISTNVSIDIPLGRKAWSILR